MAIGLLSNCSTAISGSGFFGEYEGKYSGETSAGEKVTASMKLFGAVLDTEKISIEEEDKRKREFFTINGPGWTCKSNPDSQTSARFIALVCDNKATWKVFTLKEHITLGYDVAGITKMKFTLSNGKSGILNKK